ncbi:MAG: lipoprotein-releasing ABC transporter permease subunit [Pseudomonadales bacterium]|nr:lipoprotein-releasing ABC transporter permease subunit [Halioglobus sp.]MCP5131113.1 lipoprotein-releasing ABC transporter permease subunit [Pseudomonadales bacterium]
MNPRNGSIRNYAPFIGLRYSFSRKRNRFTSVISMVSMLGMVLGVASLITVLSVMNGFGGELRERILRLVPHGFVANRDGGITNWQTLGETLRESPGVLAVSPYISDKVILASGTNMRGAVLTAIDPALEKTVSEIPGAMVAGTLESLDDGGFNVVLGASMARILRVQPGDYVEVTVPRLTVTPMGVFPRSKRLLVSGLFEVGAQPDAYQAYVSLATGQKLLGQRNVVDGLQVRTGDLFGAPAVMQGLAAKLPAQFQVSDWSQTQGSLFRAVKMEKLMVSLLLLSVVAVAAFNIVSTLVMSVAEKRRDIAVLRTMGARAGGIMLIFIAHGLGLAAVGITAGALVGTALGLNISRVTAFIETAFGVKLFDPSVYFISELPSDLQWQDVGAVVLASLVLSLLATLYPAWRATRIAPAEVLRYE